MEYYKLLVIKIDDFCSSIFHEEHYGLKDYNKVNEVKKDFEKQGYVCLVAKMGTDIIII